MTGSRETGALHQAAEIAHISEGSDAGAEPAREFALGIGQGGAQFMQRRTAEETADEQPVGLQGAR